MNIDYTLWPNADGNLGSIKVQIPDGVNTFWPEGDALVHNFVYKDGKLAGFVDTKALTVNESISTVINYDYFDIELPFTEGEIAITRGERSKYFNVRYNSINDDNVVITLKYRGCETVDDVKAVDPDYLTNDIVDGVWSEGLGDLTNGGSMFMYCSLESFNSDLSSLTNGELMFSDCCSLTSFNADLSSLTNGSYMFYCCENLTSFTYDLSSLTNGDHMFWYCEQLTSFNSDLSSLEYGNSMFYGCKNLTSFASDLSSLENCNYMFYGCENLTSFSSDLSSLWNGWNMFYGCKLDTDSVKCIANTIRIITNQPDGESQSAISIDIANTTPNDEEDAAFNTIVDKGWNVFVNGSSINDGPIIGPVSSLDENGEETVTPIPFYAKPVPATEETASYVDANGNFFNIVGAQFIYGDDLSTYGMFTCEADAAANMRLTKIEKPSISKFALNH